MSTGTFLRFASPYEWRLAIRSDLGFHNGSAIGAVYEIERENFDVKSARCFARPLKRCVEKHPYLAAVMKDKDTQKPFWEHVSAMNLEGHISILPDEPISGSNETKAIEKVLPSILDRGFPESSPPWRIVVLPLASRRCFVCFAFSHCIGDGGAGLAFHLTLLDALRETTEEKVGPFTVTVSKQVLPDAFDTPENLPVSPEFLRSVASLSSVDAGTWTGPPVFFKPEDGLRTRIRLIDVEAPLVKAALSMSRSHNTKLTATLHLLIARALSRAIPDSDVTNFASITAIDLRRAAGVGPQEWGIFISGLSAKHGRAADASLSAISDDEWAAASSLSERLAEVSTRLEDQMTGLLRYASNHKESMLSKVGGRRDCSYAMSNMGTFDGGDGTESCRISKVVNLTSALVPGPPLSFSVYSMKGGSLLCTVSWQPGALGVDEEDVFVDGICSSLHRDFESLAL